MSSDSLEPSGLPVFRSEKPKRSSRNRTKRKKQEPVEPEKPPLEFSSEQLIIPDGMEIESVQQKINSEGRTENVYKFKPVTTDTNADEIIALVKLYDELFNEILIPFLEEFPEFEPRFEKALEKLVLEQ